jgi:hypothetical protein
MRNTCVTVPALQRLCPPCNAATTWKIYYKQKAKVGEGIKNKKSNWLKLDAKLQMLSLKVIGFSFGMTGCLTLWPYYALQAEKGATAAYTVKIKCL